MKTIIIILFILSLSQAAKSQIADDIIAKTDTVGYAARDTLSRFSQTSITNLLNKWGQYYGGFIYSDSVIEVSTTAGFTSGTTFKTPAGLWSPIGWFKTPKFKDIYFRKGNSSSGTVTYSVIVRGI